MPGPDPFDHGTVTVTSAPPPPESPNGPKVAPNPNDTAASAHATGRDPGMCRQLSPASPGAPSHSGCGRCMPRPGTQFPAKSNTLRPASRSQSWLIPEKKLKATDRFVIRLRLHTSSGSSP